MSTLSESVKAEEFAAAIGIVTLMVITFCQQALEVTCCGVRKIGLTSLHNSNGNGKSKRILSTQRYITYSH